MRHATRPLVISSPYHSAVTATAVFSLVFALVVAAKGEPPAAQTAAEASLLKAEDKLFEADVKLNVVAVERGFATEAVFVHANGMTQTKADYLRAIKSGAIPIRSITTQDRVVRIFGDIGVVRGVKNVNVGEMHLSGSYLAVYIMRDGRWQMLDSQSTPALKDAEHK